jgi:hypothetical protein
VKRRPQIILYLLIVTLIIFSFECGSQNASPIKIESTERANRVLLGGSLNRQELVPKDHKTGVILVLKIKGISIEEFQNISNNEEEDIYIMAEEQKFSASVTRSGTIGGKERIELFVGVPRDALELTLYVGSYPPRTFKVKGKIIDELTEW